MSKGVNILYESRQYFSSSDKKPVVFLSHKSEDKDYVEKVGQYLMNSGIDIYLDKYDPSLQRATKESDAKKVTECIHKGIKNSDYILCITSEKTIESWWVPYEIGYGKNANKKITTLIRKDISYIPDFLKIEKIIKNISGINDFIKEITTSHSIPLKEVYDYNYSEKYANYNQIGAVTADNPLSSYLEIR